MLNTKHFAIFGALGTCYVINQYCCTFNAYEKRQNRKKPYIFSESEKMVVTGNFANDYIYDGCEIPNTIKQLTIDNVNIIGPIPEITNLTLKNIHGFRPKIPETIIVLRLDNFTDIDSNSDEYKNQSHAFTQNFINTNPYNNVYKYTLGEYIRYHFPTLQSIIDNIIRNGNIELAIMLDKIIFHYYYEEETPSNKKDKQLEGYNRCDNKVLSMYEEKIIDTCREFISIQPTNFQIPASVESLYLAGEKTTNYNSIIQRISVDNSLQKLYIENIDIDIDLELFAPNGFQHLKHIIICDSTYIHHKKTVEKLLNAEIEVCVNVTNVLSPIDSFPNVTSLWFSNKDNAILYWKLNRTSPNSEWAMVDMDGGVMVRLTRDSNGNILI